MGDPHFIHHHQKPCFFGMARAHKIYWVAAATRDVELSLVPCTNVGSSWARGHHKYQRWLDRWHGMTRTGPKQQQSLTKVSLTTVADTGNQAAWIIRGPDQLGCPKGVKLVSKGTKCICSDSGGRSWGGGAHQSPARPYTPDFIHQTSFWSPRARNHSKNSPTPFGV